MARIAAFVYGVLAYVIFLGTFLYAIGFVGHLGVPTSIDSGREGPFLQALLVDAALLGLFAVQHSVMARPAFKRVWTRVVPKPVERSTYVLASSLALLLLFACWRPMGGVVWTVDDPIGRLALQAVFWTGWLTVLVCTFVIDHFDLFGLRQVYLYLRGRECTPPQFRTPGPYQYVRHPLYFGWFLAFWAAPTMTAAHLVFAVATTAYILIAIQLEERDLITYHGDAYRAYRLRVPMIIPAAKRRAGRTSVGAEA
jgi:methanethiol S-methyltransferase